MPRTRNGFRNKGTGGGFTFVEIMIALSVTAVAFLAFLGIALQTIQDYEFYVTLNRVTQWNQQIVNDIRDDTVATKQYFGNDARGQAYLAALNLPAQFPPIDTTTLPTIEEAGIIEMDTPGNEKTGNCLFFAKTLEPFVTTVQMDATTSSTFRINVYSLYYYYLSMRVGDIIGRSPDSLDMMRWASVPVADYGQIMAIQDPDPTDFIYPQKELVANFVTQHSSNYLWDSDQDVDQAFYYCDDTGYVNSSPEAMMSIPQAVTDGIITMIPGGMREGKRTSISMNSGVPGFHGGPRVPVYAIPSLLNDGFPHGFEVQLVGPSGARKLLIRVALVKEGSSRLVGRDFKAILTTRDY